MHREFIQKLTNLVEANLTNENFGPEELARDAGMSHSNLNRKLKSINKQTISQFIREVRLTKAKELLLLNDELNIEEIAYCVGFGSSTYFIKCFRKYFGVTPLELRNQEPADKPEEQPVVIIPKTTKRTNYLVFLVIALIILIPVSVFITKKISKSEIYDKSIAVLPFLYLGHDVEYEYQAVAMMDAILTNLSKIKDLRVVSRTSVEQYHNSHKTAKDIGQEQNVDYVLEGSVLKESNKVRLIVQLINTKSENHVWSNIYDYDGKDIFSIQSLVAETIASEIQSTITPEEMQHIRKIPTNSLTAYDFYQRGKFELNNNDDSVALVKARHHFLKALELDPTFTLAYTGLAGVYFKMNFWKTYLSENFLDSVLLFANKALVYDPQCSEAYGYRAEIYNQTGRQTEALTELEKAIKYNPNNWRAYYLRSYILLYEFYDHVEGFKNKHEAILRNRGNELPNLLADLGGDYVDIGFPDLGKKYFQQALELNGDSIQYLRCLANAEFSVENFEKAYQLEKSIYIRDSIIYVNLIKYCELTGRYEEEYILGIKRYELLKKSGKTSPWLSKGVAFYLWQTGRKKEAEFYFDQQIKVCEESIRLGRAHSVPKAAYFDLAEVYACKGDKEKAYYYLDEVKKNQAFPLWFVVLIKNVPYFNSIRQEPRFQKILKDVEAKYQAEHKRVRKWLVSQGML